MIEQFHFIRPYWFALLPLVLLLGWWLQHQRLHGSGWQRLIRADLLPFLLDAERGTASRWPVSLLMTAWILALIALAGPTWDKLPQPVYRQQAALMLIMDLSPSMLAEDMTPSRLVHARHRLIDLIKARDEGLTGLVVYGGDAHLLSPLSSDRQTLLALVPTLAPALMPLPGSQVEDAVALAVQSLLDGGYQRGDLLLITDGVAESALAGIQRALARGQFQLSILGVGTREGAPVPLSDGSFATDSSGAIYLAKLDGHRLAGLAQRSEGLYRELTFDGSDLKALEARFAARALQLADTEGGPTDDGRVQRREFDTWHERGPWLVLLLLPIAALAFRRGWLVVVVFLLAQPQPVYALEWDALWLNPDQQGAKALAQGDAARAARLFKDPVWKGSAQYQQGEYAEAAKSFTEGAGSQQHYNRGVALARGGQLEEALQAFDAALAEDPKGEDARFNRDLVEKLLKRQQEQQNNQDQQDQQDQQGDPSQQQQGGQGGQNPQGEPGADSGDGSGRPKGPDDQSSRGDQGDASPEPPSSPQADSSEGDHDDQSADNASAGQNSQQPEQNDTAPPEEHQSSAQETSQQNLDQAESNKQPGAAGDSAEGSGNPEQNAELARWLRQLPDDPSGLLRRKFEYEYRQKVEAYRQGLWQPPAEQRW